MRFSTERLLTLVGSSKEDKEITGTITVPEVAHDTEEDEYVVRSLCLFFSADGSS